MTDAPLNGALLRLLAVFLITAMGAVIHGLSAEIPLGQLIFFRAAFALPLICLYAALRGGLAHELSTRRPRVHLARSLLGIFSMACSFVALSRLPVALAEALSFLAPVLTLPLAALMLREPIGKRPLLAVALGAGGVLLMLRGAMEAPGPGALLGVLAGLGYAGTMAVVRVHMKSMTATESASAIAFWFAVAASLAGLATLPLGWAAVTPASLGWLAMAGLLGGAAHVAAAEALARAPVSVIAPFDFTGLIWALGFDLVIFELLPGPAELAGALLITGAAILVVTGGRRA